MVFSITQASVMKKTEDTETYVISETVSWQLQQTCTSTTGSFQLKLFLPINFSSPTTLQIFSFPSLSKQHDGRLASKARSLALNLIELAGKKLKTNKWWRTITVLVSLLKKSKI